MGCRCIVRVLVAMVLLGGHCCVHAQDASSQGPATGEAPAASISQQLASLTARAAIVFVGQVIKIDRKGVRSDGVGAGVPTLVEVTFAVEQRVLGELGSVYIVREWGGLWPPGAQRYRLGQRAMVFLHGASGGGLNSPVDGMDGVLPVVPMGADAAPLLDVRRLAAKVKRMAGTPLPEAQAMALPEVTSLVRQAAVTPTMTFLEPTHRLLPIGFAPRPIEPIVLQARSTGDRDAQ